MRILILFALTIAATVAATNDASALGKRKRGGSSCSSCSAPVPASSCGSCDGASYGPVGPGYHAAYSGDYTTTGTSAVVRGTDGQSYTLGSDGSYYTSPVGGVSTLGGFTTQPYYNSGVYPAGYGTSRGPGYYPSAVYPAGYTSGYYGSGVYPAGYTAPLAMPGVNINRGGINVVPNLMPRR